MKQPRRLYSLDTFQLRDTYNCHSDDINWMNKINVTCLMFVSNIIPVSPLYSSVSKSKAYLGIVGSSFPQFLLFLFFFPTNSFSSLIYTSPSSIPNNSYFPNTFLFFLSLSCSCTLSIPNFFLLLLYWLCSSSHCSW